jgi:hypothetical protein
MHELIDRGIRKVVFDVVSNETKSEAQNETKQKCRECARGGTEKWDRC